jgi:drug/metabolite transporter (DMT)-like permease
VTEAILPAEHPDARVRRPAIGVAMVVAAALLFAVNGTVAKVILLESEIDPFRLAEVRSLGAFVGLGLLLLAVNRRGFRVTRRELPFLVVFGIAGLALVQWSYFAAIERLAIGVALLIQFVAPLLVALYARFFGGEFVRRRIWAALALAFAGLALVVEVWSGLTLDGVGLAAAVVACLTYAFYILMAEREVGKRDPISLAWWGFVFATLFWSAALPWWEFPAATVGEDASLLGNLAELSVPVWALVATMIVLGTIAPFGLLIASLRHVTATRAAIAAMLEPVAGALVAYVWLGETLGGLQLVGGAVVLAAIGLAQTAR